MALVEGLQLPFGIQPINPLPVNSWEGPYNSIAEALSSIPIGVRYPTMNNIKILDPDGNQLYWFKNGITDSDLVLMVTDSNIVQGEINDLQTGLTKETADRKSGDLINYNLITGLTGTVANNYNDLFNQLTGETYDRIVGDNLLQNEITSGFTNVNNEINGLTNNVNKKLDISGITSVDNSIIIHVSGDTVDLKTQVVDLSPYATKEYVTGLTNELNNEIGGLTTVVNNNYNLLTGETFNRIIGDNNLQNQLNNEITGRTYQDNILNNLITGLTQNKLDISGGTINGNLNVINGIISGNGSGLTNVPASGVTGLSLDRITSGLNTAIISSSGLTVNNNVNAISFVKNGGLNTQFLKADGSSDSTIYLPSGVTTNNIPDSLNKRYITDVQLSNIHQQNTDTQLLNNGHIVSLDAGGTLHIENLSQVGTGYTTHSEQVYTTKNEIILRDGAVSGLAPGEFAGLRAKLYDGVNDGILEFDSTGTGRIGDLGSTQPIATREENPLNNGLAFWNGSTYRFETESPLSLPISTTTNNALTGETYNRIQADLLKLDLSGGTVTGNLIVSGATISTDGILTNYVQYKTGVTPTLVGGLRRLNTNIGTTELKLVGHNVTLQDGFEVLGHGYNNTSSVILNGTPVTAVSGFDDSTMIEPAIASDHTNQKYRVIGVTTEDILPYHYGCYTKIGEIHDLNLSMFNVGDDLYLSQTVSGGFITSNSLNINGRTIEIGKVLDNSSTAGILSLSIHNEFGTANNTLGEINTFTINDTSTGVFSFEGIIKSGNTFSVGATKGWIVDNETNPLKPTVQYIEYSGQTGLTTPYLTTNIITHILLKSDSTILLQPNTPTPIDRRNNIYLGKIGHPDKTNLSVVFNVTDIVFSPLSQIRDMFIPIKLINDGVYPYSTANLNLNTTGGILYDMGISFNTNSKDPNRIILNGNNPATFQYRTQSGGTLSNRTTIDPTNYDLNGVVTAIGNPSKQATNQRIYLLQDGSFRIQYGQTIYSDLITAINSVSSESFMVFQNFKDNGILIGILSVVSNASDLTNVSQAKYQLVSKFGESLGGSGSGSVTTLQIAYNNSSEPEILTNSVLKALTIKRGSLNDSDNLIEFQNGIGTTVVNINALGNISGTTFTKYGGLNTQFLKADGSVDNNSYLNLSGGTLTGTLSGTNIDLPLVNDWSTLKNSATNGGIRISEGDGSGILRPALDITVGANYIKSYLPIKSPAYQDLNGNIPFVAQNGGIIYHTTPWINTGTISTSGTTVTGVGTSFSNLMVGAKIIINNEERIIATYVSTTSITINSAFSQNYSGVGFEVRRRLFYREGNVIYLSENSDYKLLKFDGDNINIGNTYSSGFRMALSQYGLAATNQFFLQWASDPDYNNLTKDTGLKRNSAGILEINNGTTGQYRDLILRNLTTTTIKPLTDSTTGLTITKADGVTPVMTIDTTNNYVITSTLKAGNIEESSDRFRITGTYTLWGGTIPFVFTNGSYYYNTQDLAFIRNSAGILEINNATTGNGAGLSLQTIYQQISGGTSTGDVTNDRRQINSGGTLSLQRATVSGATKGSGTWVTDFKVDASGNTTTTGIITATNISGSTINTGDEIYVGSITPALTYDLWIDPTSPDVTLQEFVNTFSQKSANYSIQNTDGAIECTGDTFALTLPTAVGIAGRTFVIKNTGSGTITLNTTSSQTIDGQLTQTMSQWNSITVISNGTNYLII